MCRRPLDRGAAAGGQVLRLSGGRPANRVESTVGVANDQGDDGRPRPSEQLEGNRVADLNTPQRYDLPMRPPCASNG